MSGLDTEADSDIEADSWIFVVSTQRHLRVNLLRQSQRRLHLNHWSGPTQRTHSETVTAC